MMLDFYELIEIMELRAVKVALYPTQESVWRMKMRDYSERFHTPLHEVAKLDPEFVLQNLIEVEYTPSNMEEDPEGVLEMLKRIEDPNYSPIGQEDLEDLVDNAINNLTKKGLGKRKKSVEDVDLPTPKKGGMKFDDLAQADAQSEQGTSGFED